MIGINQIEKWSSTHHPKWLVFLRVILGVSLFVKGISFLNNALTLQQLIANSSVNSYPWLAQVVTWIHLLGGFLIIIGLFTRAAALIQIPILLGAIIFINAKKGIFSVESDLIFSLIVLLLLVVFFIEGGGPFSLDSYFKKDAG